VKSKYLGIIKQSYKYPFKIAKKKTVEKFVDSLESFYAHGSSEELNVNISIQKPGQFRLVFEYFDCEW
jgi:hypothetical protein